MPENKRLAPDQTRKGFLKKSLPPAKTGSNIRLSKEAHFRLITLFGNKMSTFPQWLSEALVSDTINWDDFTPIDPLALRQIITLHDSSQVKVLIDSAWDGYVMIAVRWDTYWNKDILNYPGDSVEKWPFLVIQIEGVSKIAISDFEPIGGIQRAVSDIEPEQIEGGFRTRLMDVYGGKIDFTHTKGFRLALFSANGEPLQINKAEQDAASNGG